MAQRKRHSKKKISSGGNWSLKEALGLYAKLADLKKEMNQAAAGRTEAEERLADLEVHVSLLARLLTTLCIEKFGIRLGTLKRLVHRIEEEAVRDSQIMELESLYKLTHSPSKKAAHPPAKAKDDPWEQIS